MIHLEHTEDQCIAVRYRATKKIERSGYRDPIFEVKTKEFNNFLDAAKFAGNDGHLEVIKTIEQVIVIQ